MFAITDIRPGVRAAIDGGGFEATWPDDTGTSTLSALSALSSLRYVVSGLSFAVVVTTIWAA